MSSNSRQLKTTWDLLESRRPRLPSPPIGGDVRHDGRGSRGIADAVCITPSPDDYVSQMIQEEPMGGGPLPRQQPPPSNVAPEVGPIR